MLKSNAPTPLRIIAWLSIVIGSLMILSSVMALLVFLLMLPPLPEGMGPQHIKLPELMDSELMRSTASAVLFGMLKHFDLLAYVQLAVAAIIVWAGVDLLRLRAWARTAIEVFCWLALVFHVLFAALWIGMWSGVYNDWSMRFPYDPSDKSDFNLGVPVGYLYGPIAIGLLVIGALSVPLVLALRYLRGPEARAAVAGH